MIEKSLCLYYFVKKSRLYIKKHFQNQPEYIEIYLTCLIDSIIFYDFPIVQVHIELNK